MLSLTVSLIRGGFVEKQLLLTWHYYTSFGIIHLFFSVLRTLLSIKLILKIPAFSRFFIWWCYLCLTCAWYKVSIFSLSASSLHSLWLVKQKKKVCIELTMLPGHASWTMFSRKLVDAIYNWSQGKFSSWVAFLLVSLKLIISFNNNIYFSFAKVNILPKDIDSFFAASAFFLRVK